MARWEQPPQLSAKVLSVGQWELAPPFRARQLARVILDSSGSPTFRDHGERNPADAVRLQRDEEVRRERRRRRLCNLIGHRLGEVEVLEGLPLVDPHSQVTPRNVLVLELYGGVTTTFVVEPRKRLGCLFCGAVVGGDRLQL